MFCWRLVTFQYLNPNRIPINPNPRRTQISVLYIVLDTNKPITLSLGNIFQSSLPFLSPPCERWWKIVLKNKSHRNLDLTWKAQGQVYPYVPDRTRYWPYITLPKHMPFQLTILICVCSIFHSTTLPHIILVRWNPYIYDKCLSINNLF